MNYNLANLYHGFQKYHYGINNMPQQIKSFEETAKYVNGYTQELSTIDKYLLDGFYKDYPEFMTINSEDIYNKLSEDKSIYQILDNIFCSIWG